MSFEESRIERLKRSLYSRNEKAVPKEKRTPIQPTSGMESNVPTSWGVPPSFTISPESVTRKSKHFFNKFLIASLIFFFVSLGIALFIFFGGVNMISSNNVDVVVTAPSSVSSGEELPMGLSVVNGNRTNMEDAVLFIDYPEGVRAVDESNKVLSHQKIDLGTIVKGGSSDYSIRALLFGEKDAIKTFTLRLEYKVVGSNAVFSKEKTYDVIIGSSPVLLNVVYPKEVNSGQQLTLSVDITSNSSVVMKSVLIKVEYPYGFTYKDSNMKSLSGNFIWNIGDLKNGDKKILSIRGVLVGQNEEDRSFRISAGTRSSDSSKDFETNLVEQSVTIGIRKSFFDLRIISTENNVSSVGQSIPITVNWQNTLPDKIVNNRIEASISGNALDRYSVSVTNGGFYRSIDNTIVWDKNTNPDLATLSPGQEGQQLFSLSSLQNLTQVRAIKNPHIDVHVEMVGDRIGLDTATVSSSQDITIKLASTPSLSSKSYRNIGPFVNSGPIPPHADMESTYTITWTLANTTNDLKDTIVSAVLPPGVEWKNEFSPGSERISYNPDTRIISWNIGNVSSGTGFTYSAKEVSFKVGLTPSVNQIGSPGVLLLQTIIEASDTYTITPIKINAQSANTQYSDPGYRSEFGNIVK